MLINSNQQIKQDIKNKDEIDHQKQQFNLNNLKEFLNQKVQNKLKRAVEEQKVDQKQNNQNQQLKYQKVSKKKYQCIYGDEDWENDSEEDQNEWRQKNQGQQKGWTNIDISEKGIKERLYRESQLRIKEEMQRQELERQEQERLKQIQERKQKIIEKRMNRCKNLKKISKEIYQMRKEYGVFKIKEKKIKYKAVPADTLDFELVQKEKKKKSHIKLALKKYKEIMSQTGDEVFKEDILLKEKEIIDNSENQKDSKYIKKQVYKLIDDEDFETEYEIDEKSNKIIKVNQFVADINFDQKISYQIQTNYNGVKVRDWVDHILSPEIENQSLELINSLAYMQAVKKLKEPLKYQKRIVSGLKECSKSLILNLQKSVCIILAINLQVNPLQKGSDEKIKFIIDKCKERRVPIIHGSTRAKLGRAFTGKFGPRVSCISILNYQGREAQFKELLNLVDEKRKEFYQKIQGSY